MPKLYLRFKMQSHEKYMRRCIQLAKNAIGNTLPNPMVGAVIVANNKIIGEGFHTKAGEPHAEVKAINSVKKEDRHLLNESTIYVSLEPCAHFGKTPPCSDLIIENNIPNIVIGTIDPFSEVAGKGIEKLKNAGRNVVVDVLKEDCIHLNRRFFTFHTQQRPFIILKWAQTLDGYIDKERIATQPEINWITQQETQLLTHKWRAQEDAILVGKTTVINDNPSLTVRAVSGNNPTRIVIDPNLELITQKEKYSVFNTNAKTIVFNYLKNEEQEKLSLIKIDYINTINDILSHLYKLSIQSLIVEGGAYTLQQFIDTGNWDEARILIGKTYFSKGKKAPQLPYQPKAIEYFSKDTILYFKNAN